MIHDEATDQEPTRRQPAISILRWTVLVLLFTAAAVYWTWPLASDLDAGLPLGSETVATVPLFNLWTLSWNVEKLGEGFSGYWQAPIFHPAADAFAFSEPQPVFGLLAFLLSRFGLSMVAVYGLLLMASLAANGVLTVALLRRVGLAWLPAMAGGFLVLVLPFTHQELGVLQLVPLAGVLCFALAVLAFADGPKLSTGLALGLALAFSYGLSAQVAVFCALAATPAAFWLWWPQRRNRQAWIGLGAGVVLFFGLVSPLLVAQLRATSNEDFVRSAETIKKRSARPAHYLETPWPQLLPTPGIMTADKPSARAFWPGTVRVLLAVGAVVGACRAGRRRRHGVAAVLVLGTGVVLSFGGHIGAFGFSLADALRVVPGLGQIRNFFRFALFAQLAVALLAAGSLHWLLGAAGRRVGTGTWRKRVETALPVAALALLAVVEMPTSPGTIEPIPPLDQPLPWLGWIEEQTAEDDVLAFLPFPKGKGSADYAVTAQWMFWQQRHWRPMVNGYSGFFPRRFKQLKKIMEDFPSPESLTALREAGVTYCIVPRRVIEASPPPDTSSPVQLEMVFRDEQYELAIFALRGGSP